MGDSAGQWNVTLTVEDEAVVHRPTALEVEAAVRRLRPAGPSFAILERGDDYMQVGGGAGRYTVECRVWGEPFRHIVAGKGPPSDQTERVHMSQGGVVVRKHEVLSRDDVMSLFTAFAVSGQPSPAFVWRDVSAQFIPAGDADQPIEEA